MQSRFIGIIPAFNEASVIEANLKSIREFRTTSRIPFDILVVNDGSYDDTGAKATKIADFVLNHRKNCGLGAALSTGFEFAKRRGYQGCFTIDADGQHDPADIGRVITQLEKGVDVVIGSRFIGKSIAMPRGRKIILKISNFITWLFFGVWTSDSQSGFRGLSRRALDSLSLRSNSMEVSSEIFGEVRRLGLKMAEVPISVRYTAYSLKKGQKNLHGAKVLLKLLYKMFR